MSGSKRFGSSEGAISNIVNSQQKAGFFNQYLAKATSIREVACGYMPYMCPYFASIATGNSQLPSIISGLGR